MEVLSCDNYFASGSSLVLVLEYMQTDLRQVLAAIKKPLPQPIIKAIFLQILRGLNATHECNLLHRVGNRIILSSHMR